MNTPSSSSHFDQGASLQHGIKASAVKRLLESDMEYFRAGAELITSDCWSLWYLPNIGELTAGCTAQIAGLSALASDLHNLEATIRGLGYSHARIYQQEADNAVYGLFSEAGYRDTCELGLLLSRATFRDSLSSHSSRITLRLVDSEVAWEKKQQLHASGVGLAHRSPDGHQSNAKRWVAMERLKCQAGFMLPYLAEYGGTVCGAISVARCGHLVRLKNVYVHPDFRRRGIGASIVRTAVEQWQKEGDCDLGIFAIDRSSALKVYLSLGFEIVTRQTEWYKTLS